MRIIAAIVGLLLVGACAREPAVERVEWPVMGTVGALQMKGGDAAKMIKVDAAAVRETFSKIEKLLNAHNAASELSRLASADDAVILASCDDFVRPCYCAAFKFRDATDGRFNPRWRGANTLDLGAIAKGYAVDVASRQLKAKPGVKALVDLGGNLKAVGGDWMVAIAGSERMVTLKDGMACATSGEYFRGRHIRDGRSGAELKTKIFSVTVIHPDSAMIADALSTIMFILGKEKGDAFLKTHHPESTAIWLE